MKIDKQLLLIALAIAGVVFSPAFDGENKANAAEESANVRQARGERSEASADDPNDPYGLKVGLREGFANPPAGYGEVPFWWWTGEKLDVERLNWEVDELARKGISGVQVNYAHQDVRNDVQPNWLTYPNEPEVLTDEWFDVFQQVAEHCRELNMGVGLSGYTLDWQSSPNNLFDRLIYRDRETQSRTLRAAVKKDVKAGTPYADALSEADYADGDTDELVRIVAYPKDAQGVLNTATFKELDPAKLVDAKADVDSEIWVYRAKREAHTLNPLHPDSGRKVVERFFAPFETRAKEALGAADDGKSTLGLNYFFQDELQLGTGETIWADDAAQEFEKRKGYSYWTAAPAMFGGNVGDMAEKYRLDYMDVRVKLAEERYFIPIYQWNANRGRIYACDPGSRGRDPNEFCDYFSAIRWYTAPGHDTPGGHADFIKNKVSSSIAHFYQRPRVWLEGYHSFGWGAEPKQLFFATNENFLFGANLLNLHGLYYTTYGGYWEWAPPCYHFRQPYWETFGAFLKYFERLSFALTRGVETPDVVVLYPVSAYHSKLNGGRACGVAFEAAARVFADGRDVLFIDDESIARAEIRGDKLCVAGAEHSVLILPSIQGIRWSTLQKALALYRAGGTVIALDAAPVASDRAGRNDAQLDAAVREIFGGSASELKTSSIVRNAQGGVGAFFSPKTAAEPAQDAKVGSEGALSKLRRYSGGFEGHWVWAKELKQDVRFKHVVSNLADEPREYQAKLLCDNAGALYVNGRKICENADYNVGWQGVLTLRNGDVLTIDGHDDDAPRRGSAGMFFALSDGEKTLIDAEDFRYTFDAATDVQSVSSADIDGFAQADVGNVHVLHRTGVNSELAGARSEPIADTDDSVMWKGFGEFLAKRPRDAFDAKTFAPCSIMKRSSGEFDLYFVMKGKKNSQIAFRSLGRAEFYDPYDGSMREPEYVATPTEGKLAGTSVVTWPYNEDEAGLIVFWKNEQPKNRVASLEYDGVEIASLNVDANGKWSSTAYGAEEESKIVLTSQDGKTHTLVGAAHEKASKQTFDGDWTFELVPTLDNRWGDFRLPVSDAKIGPEAQRFDLDQAENCLYGYGRKFYELGPFPNDADLTALESSLAKTESVDPSKPVEFNGKKYEWRPYSFSWRQGIEGNPGREGYHGLKEKIDSRFIGLGAASDGFNETVYNPEEEGSVYYLWTRVGVKEADSKSDRAPVDVYVSGGAPSAIYVAGKKFEGDAYLDADANGSSVALLRYDAAGRYACCFVRRQNDDRSASKTIALDGADMGAFNGLMTGLREETPETLDPEKRVPLSTIWFNTPGVLNFDPVADMEPCADKRGASASFIAPPGLKSLNVPSYGRIAALLVDGKETAVEKTEQLVSGQDFWQGKRTGAKISGTIVDRGANGAFCDSDVVWTTITLPETLEREARITLVVSQVTDGRRDAAVFPEPVRLTCGSGKTTLGDWNDRGVLENYSGGAKYTKTFCWDGKTRADGRVTLDLGDVGVSCRVFINGKHAGDLSNPPWTIDVSDFLKEGENTLEVDVYTALSNYYLNIPSRYKGRAPSGLIGPVELRFEPSAELVE